MDEVSKHNTEASLWIVLYGRVYDMTKFQFDHPGGADIILETAGADATKEFEDILHSKQARELAKTYVIGKIKDTKLGNLFESNESNTNSNDGCCVLL